MSGRRSGNGSDEVFGGRVIGVDNAKVSFFEEFTLGPDVIFKGFMIVQVLVSDVGHDGDFYRNAKSAKLGKGVGSNLKNEIFCTRIFDGFNATIKGEGIGGGHVFNLLKQTILIGSF